MAKTESETFSITVEQDVPTEMRDGVLLRSDIYRPIEAAACPVLLCRTPYDKGQEVYIQIARALASNGYIAVVQDIRGRGISDGEYFWQFQNNTETFDAEDGYDTVEWAAGIPAAMDRSEHGDIPTRRGASGVSPERSRHPLKRCLRVACPHGCLT